MEKRILQVRLPGELHERLTSAKGSRSLNAEIVARLEGSFTADDDVLRQAREGGACVAPGLPAATGGSPTRVFGSEKPRAKRSVLCAHRRRPDEFCPRCD